MDWFADGIAAAALLLSVIAFVDGRRKAGQADRAAEASAASAQRSAEAAERSAAAHEQLAEATAAEQRARRQAPPWDVLVVRPSTYQLVNRGNDNAHEVRITAGDPESVIVRGDVSQPRVVNPRGAVEFVAITHANTVDRSIVIRWKRTPLSDDREWGTTLPRN